MVWTLKNKLTGEIVNVLMIRVSLSHYIGREHCVNGITMPCHISYAMTSWVHV